ncbi:hypothetical protein CEXT_230561 [Caerostris extrusa]|uniref:Uncharacterized protein n=1 Tax=Caerostris extrusa TaxID=172846 RepID=A0AAV4UA39_CAEEX|nr:hypothetical protein CEXT_230561 [Caerostris extrusa]
MSPRSPNPIYRASEAQSPIYCVMEVPHKPQSSIYRVLKVSKELNNPIHHFPDVLQSPIYRVSEVLQEHKVHFYQVFSDIQMSNPLEFTIPLHHSHPRSPNFSPAKPAFWTVQFILELKL